MKSWLDEGGSGWRGTLLSGTSFLHIKEPYTSFTHVSLAVKRLRRFAFCVLEKMAMDSLKNHLIIF